MGCIIIGCIEWYPIGWWYMGCIIIGWWYIDGWYPIEWWYIDGWYPIEWWYIEWPPHRPYSSWLSSFSSAIASSIAAVEPMERMRVSRTNRCFAIAGTSCQALATVSK